MMQDLTANEQKRLKDLQDEAAGASHSFYARNLTLPDLMLMLRHDPGLRALIGEIARQPGAESAVQGETVELPLPVPVTTGPPASTDRLRDGLAGPLRLLSLLERDETLRTAWLGSLHTSGDAQVPRLIVNAAHWDRIEALWDVLAQRCKQQQRAATADEMVIVDECVRIHNLLWDGRRATMVSAEARGGFDFAVHERAGAAGQLVRETWLPGLKNAAGQLRKKTLVHTE